MYRPNLNTTKAGFTLIELVVTIAIIAILSSVILVSLAGSRERGENNTIVRQVREYVTALELVYKANGGHYIHVQTGSGWGPLSHRRCLADTTGSGRCNWDGSSPLLLPDTAGAINTGMVEFRRAMTNAALPVIIRESSGSDFYDSVFYLGSRSGTAYRLFYPLNGENTECQLSPTKIYQTGPSNHEGVTICVYCSDRDDTFCQ